MSRYGNANILELRGVKRLTYDEKWIFAQHIGRLLEAEVQPLDGPTSDDD